MVFSDVFLEFGRLSPSPRACWKLEIRTQWFPRFLSLVCLKIQHKVWLSRFLSLVCLKIQHKAWLSRFLSLVCLKIQHKVWLPRFLSLVYLKTQHKVWLSRFFSLVCLKIEHKVWLSWHSDCTYCEENLIVAGRQEEGSTLWETVKCFRPKSNRVLCVQKSRGN